MSSNEVVESRVFSFEGTGGSTWRKSGEDDEEGTPVPIPNTAVKLLDAEDS